MSPKGMLATGDIIMKKVLEFLKDDSGQTSTEYILLVAVVAFIIFKFKGVLEEKLIGIANTVFGNANDLANQIK